MTLIGMGEAAKRAGVSGANAIRIALMNAKVPLTKISERSYAVEESDFEAFLKTRGGELRPGRPRKPRKDAPPSPSE